MLLAEAEVLGLLLVSQRGHHALLVHLEAVHPSHRPPELQDRLRAEATAILANHPAKPTPNLS